MRGKKLYAFLVMLLLALQACVASAAGYDAEYTYSTGTIWGFEEADTTYEVSDAGIAEIVYDANGLERIKLKRPGDVYITATFPASGSQMVCLLHVTGHPVDETAVNQNTFAQEVLDLVNRERAKVGRKPLRLSEELLQAAAVRGEEISRHYAHTRPDGSPFQTVLGKRKSGFLGENIAAGATSPQQVMEMWMNSPGHKKNILYSHYDELGVGYIYVPGSEYGHYWVQLFRGRA